MVILVRWNLESCPSYENWKKLENYQHLLESWDCSNANAGFPVAPVCPKRSDFMIAVVDVFFCMSSWGEEFCTATMSAMPTTMVDRC